MDSLSPIRVQTNLPKKAKFALDNFNIVSVFFSPLKACTPEKWIEEKCVQMVPGLTQKYKMLELEGNWNQTWWLGGKESAANAGDMGSIPGWRSPGEGNDNPLLIFLPGKSHGQRTLAGYSPWGLKIVRHNSATKQQSLGWLSGAWLASGKSEVCLWQHDKGVGVYNNKKTYVGLKVLEIIL